MTALADLSSHHIEGFAAAALAAGRRADFKVPLISQIDDRLWMGGCKDGVQLDGFDLVVSLYPWEKYAILESTTRVEVKLYDSGEVPDSTQLFALAEAVNTARRAGARVLVHCQAGLNRSGLVTALAMVTDGGFTPAAAIARLRELRHEVVLCNQAFEGWLLSLGPDEERTAA